jgi:hypothetical protein
MRRRQEIWHTYTLTLMTRSIRKNLLKTMNPRSLQPSARCQHFCSFISGWKKARAILSVIDP